MVQAMAYDQDLADRVREQLAGAQAAEKVMFGGLAFFVGGNLAVAASGRGGLLVRVDPAESDRLLGEPDVEPMQMGRRAPMKGWLHVAAGAITDDDALGRWVQRGVRYALTLPRK